MADKVDTNGTDPRVVPARNLPQRDPKPVDDRARRDGRVAPVRRDDGVRDATLAAQDRNEAEDDEMVDDDLGVEQRIDTNINTRLNRRVAGANGVRSRTVRAEPTEEDFDAMERRDRRHFSPRRDYDRDDEVARYELTEPAFIDNILMEAGARISYAGVPGPHMKALNAAAEAAKADAPDYGNLEALPGHEQNVGEFVNLNEGKESQIDKLVGVLQKLAASGGLPDHSKNADQEDEIERRVAERMRQREADLDTADVGKTTA